MTIFRCVRGVGLTWGVTFRFLAIAGWFWMAWEAGTSTPARATSPRPGWELHETEFQTLGLKTDVSSFVTRSNLNAQGIETRPPGFASLHIIQTDVGAEYGFAPRWTMYGRLSLVNSVLETDGVALRSRSGLGDQVAGLVLRAGELGLTEFFLQSQLDYPFYASGFGGSNDPELGDGSADWTTGGFLRAELGEVGRAGGHRLMLLAGSGVTLRSSGYSAHIPYFAGLSLEPRESSAWILGAGVNGIFSLHTDARSGARGTGGSGGSFVTSSPAPTLAALGVRLGYQFSADTSLTASAARTVMGENVPVGTAYTLSLSLRFGGEGPNLVKEDRSQEISRMQNPGPKESALITDVEERMHLVKIDRGLDDGWARDAAVEIFEGERLTARGHVEDAHSREAVVKIDEYVESTPIREGLRVRQVGPRTSQ